MTTPHSTPLDTPQGQIHTVDRQGATIYRVGYAPNPWEWTPWEYATNGRFAGRWDDPDGVWRTLYCGISALACYLEVLAFARPSPQLVAELDDIAVDDEDHDTYPTLPLADLGSFNEPRHRSVLTVGTDLQSTPRRFLWRGGCSHVCNHRRRRATAFIPWTTVGRIGAGGLSSRWASTDAKNASVDIANRSRISTESPPPWMYHCSS